CAIHPGIHDTSCARWPSENDFSCGFQVALSLGTRSNNRRVEAISCSNSGSNVSEMLMTTPWLPRVVVSSGRVDAMAPHIALGVAGARSARRRGSEERDVS